MNKRLFKQVVSFLLAWTTIASMSLPHVEAVTTVPQLINYLSRLNDSTGNPVTVSIDIRFSLWSDADVDPTDYTAPGVIDPVAGGFSGYSETHSVTPDSNGVFNVDIGSITPVPDFILPTHSYLQVDVKFSGSPVSTYETLDPDGDSTVGVTDRKIITEAPYASNADFIDNAELGVTAGDIPVLDGSAMLPISTVPAGTNSDDFNIDANDDAPGAVTLTFGVADPGMLSWGGSATGFILDDDLTITDGQVISGGGATFGSSPDQVLISSTGDITFTGAARPVKVIDLPLGSIRRDGIRMHQDSAGLYYRYDDTEDDEGLFNIILPNDYAGGAITMTLYWKPNSGGTIGNTVNWDLDHHFVDTGDNPVTKVVTSSSVSEVTGASNVLQTSTFTISGGLSTNDLLNMTLRRNSSGAGADTFDEGADLYAVKLEYLADSLGN